MAAYQAIIAAPILAFYLWQQDRKWRPGWLIVLVTPLVLATYQLYEKQSNGTVPAAVLGAVAPIPWRSKAAEAALAGKPLNEQTAIAAGEAAVAEAKPMSGNAYKVQIAKTAVKRAIMRAAGLKTV